MSIDFLQRYAGERMAVYPTQMPVISSDQLDENDSNALDLTIEPDAQGWEPIPVLKTGTHGTWEGMPTRFVDGKDVGETIATVPSPSGHLVPIRLSEIGAVETRIINGIVYRTYSKVERVVSMELNGFPFDEVEAFAEDLHRNEYRLLPVIPPGGVLRYDFEMMRIYTKNRSNSEMELLELGAVARDPVVPTILDGHLSRSVGNTSWQILPIAGVIKSHHVCYLPPEEQPLLYRLEPGERTRLFALRNKKFPVVSWYLRLTGSGRSMPTLGVIRIEVPLGWFESGDRAARIQYVSDLSCMLYDYRTHDSTYARKAVSIHPIVRAEELLGALFSPSGALMHRFYRLTGL